jgi:hypothetical protein
MVVGRDVQSRPHLVGLRKDRLRDHRAERRGRGRRRVKKIGMEETKLEKLARLSGKVTSKALDALGRRGFDLRGKMSAPINRVPRRAPPPKPKMDE